MNETKDGDPRRKPLRFGTSGLRGLVRDMTDLEVTINTRGFVDYLTETGELGPGARIALAEDLRATDPTTGLSSSPRIARAVARAVGDAGYELVHAGQIPTPALAYWARAGGPEALPCIMVTGSHIPADRNGVKFYKKTGEVLKTDEPGILAAVARVRAQEYARPAAESAFDAGGMLPHTPSPLFDPRAEQAYLERYTQLGGTAGRPLDATRVVVYQHSAVGRDLVVQILEALGAEVVPVERSDGFVPIDTEDVAPADERRYGRFVTEHQAAALVSTDGDGDRPLLIDERGRFHRGDALGIITAEWLGAQFAALPISCSDAVDLRAAERGEHRPMQIEKTRIGSPHVIAAMQAAIDRGQSGVVGWEANGGFLTGTDFDVQGACLPALPTRDAMLPIVAALLAAAQRGTGLAQLFADLPARATRAGLLDEFPSETSRAILAGFRPEDAAITELSFGSDTIGVQHLEDDTPCQLSPTDEGAEQALECRARLSQLFTKADGFGAICRINTIDGLRVWFDDGDIAHLRPSGNAPQFRIYVVSDSQQRADRIVELAIAEPDGLLRRLERAHLDHG